MLLGYQAVRRCALKPQAHARDTLNTGTKVSL
jgi:hypothetical protein